MKLLLAMTLLLLLDITLSRKVKRKDSYQQQPHYNYEQVHHTEHFGTPQEGSQYVYQTVSSHKGTSKAGYSTGSGLRFIAQGSADQATSAVANQNAAAKQAAYVAKNTLAQTASQAANTALTALKGKEVLLKRLEQQSLEAHQHLENELTQLQQAKRSAKAAQQSAQQAINHVSVLTAALNNAQSSADHAQKAATEAAAELASQTAMVGQAKGKLEQLEEQLQAARLDFEATRDAAEKASNSAQEAQNNANEAAIHASIGLHETAITNSGSSHVEVEHAGNHNYGEPPQERGYDLSGY